MTKNCLVITYRVVNQPIQPMNDPEPAPITVRRPRNSTKFFIMNENGTLIAEFQNGLMEGVTFNTTLPNLTIKREGGPTLITSGALVGTKLQFGDEKKFVMPSEVVVTAIIHYDPRERCFFNPETGNRVDSADFVVFDQGLITAGWIKRT